MLRGLEAEAGSGKRLGIGTKPAARMGHRSQGKDGGCRWKDGICGGGRGGGARDLGNPGIVAGGGVQEELSEGKT